MTARTRPAAAASESTRDADLTGIGAHAALGWGILAAAVMTGVIGLTAGRLADVPHLPDAGASWYYWKLPEPTVLTRVSAWGLYLAHQFALWSLVFVAQRRRLRYSDRLHRLNVAALAVNAAFVVVHWVHTHTLYDKLAQDVSIYSSQGSVILLLVWVLAMENGRRGLFAGRRVPIPASVGDALRRYHGYVFAWAAVYTFWYHPDEGTSGHLVGFVYMFLLLVQSSLFFTRAHTNRWWTFTLEALVLIHGAAVAYVQAGAAGFWPMFLFGFAGILVLTQMHGLGLSVPVRWAIFVAYLAGVVAVYSGRGWGKLDEIVRIPAIEYVLVAVLIGLLWLIVRVAAALTGRRRVRTA